jgi:hypothetical protein
MSSINPLGRTLNATVSVTTAVKRVSLRDCAGVLFLMTNSSGTTPMTITEANAASGGTSQACPGIPVGTTYWTQATGTGVWTANVTTVASQITTTIAAVGALHAIYVPQGALSDGFSYLAASHATGTIVYIMGDLDVQRRATNLRDVTA